MPTEKEFIPMFEEEPEFEMSDDIKLQDQGFDSVFLEIWGDKPVFKKNGDVRMDFFKAYVDWCDNMDLLNKIDYLKLDDKQKEYWSDKKKSIEVVEKIELTEPFEPDKVQILVEDDNEFIDIDDYKKTIELNRQYIDEVARLKKFELDAGILHKFIPVFFREGLKVPTTTIQEDKRIMELLKEMELIK